MTESQVKIETFQNLLIDIATSGNHEEEDYKKLRAELIENKEINNLLPNFVQTNRTKSQFWQFIKRKFSSYGERRAFIWAEISKALTYLETKQNGIINETATPLKNSIKNTLIWSGQKQCKEKPMTQRVQ